MKILLSDLSFKHIPKIIRFSAIDGNTNFYNNLILSKKNINNNEYACLLSHLKVIYLFASTYNSQSIALICEDDITLDFKKYWKKNLSEVIKNAPSDWEILMLTYIYIGNEPPKEEYTKNDGKYLSAAAYLIKNSAAKKIINEIYKNNKFIINEQSHQADIFLYKLVNTYVYKYPYFIYEYNGTSTIVNKNILRTIYFNKSREFIEQLLNK